MTKLGVLDIGTNSIHLVLAEVGTDFSYKILDRYKDMTRLGDGTFATHRLSDAAMKRGLEVIRNLATLAKNKGYEQIEAVATSAVREAKNGGDFLLAVARETGLTARVVTGHEEARLIYLGVRHSMDLSGPQTLIVDVGGGSVELIVGDSAAMLHGQSLKLGAIRMKDQYLRDDPPTSKMLRTMREAIEAETTSTLKRFRFKTYGRLVGTSGMVANLIEIIHQQRTGRPVPQLHMTTVTLKEVEATERELVEADLSSRLAIPGLDPKRADTLLPAVTVVRILMECSGQDVLTACDCGIREGLIYDFIERHRERIRTEQEIPNVRRRNVISFARRCQYLEPHSRHVADLATRLFDATKPLHKLAEREREWLEYAALLHDVGYLINSRSHHKHGYYLIMNSDLFGFTAEEIAVLATIVRYHRRALPKPKHEEWKTVAPNLRKTVAALSALLRIADALDRSQFSVIRGFLVKLGKPVAVQLDATSDAELEIWAARGRADLFARVFKRPITFTLRSLKRAAP